MGSPGTPSPVIVYGADWCADCVRSKRLLNRLGVDHQWIDLVDEPEHTAEVVRRNQGGQSIPVIVFSDGTHLTEPSNAELAAKLDALGLLAV